MSLEMKTRMKVEIRGCENNLHTTLGQLFPSTYLPTYHTYQNTYGHLTLPDLSHSYGTSLARKYKKMTYSTTSFSLCSSIQWSLPYFLKISIGPRVTSPTTPFPISFLFPPSRPSSYPSIVPIHLHPHIHPSILSPTSPCSHQHQYQHQYLQATSY